METTARHAQTRNRDAEGPRPLKPSLTTQAFVKDMVRQRKALGKSQTQIAAAMRTSASAVSRLEAGADVQLSTLEKYVAALGLRLEIKGIPLRKPKSPRPLSDVYRARPRSGR